MTQRSEILEKHDLGFMLSWIFYLHHQTNQNACEMTTGCTQYSTVSKTG